MQIRCSIEIYIGVADCSEAVRYAFPGMKVKKIVL